MPTIMTILSCVLIGQFSTDQPQSGATIEPIEQVTSPEDSRSSAQVLTPAAQAENAVTDQVVPAETSEASTSPGSTVVPSEASSALTEQSAPLRMRPPQLIAEAMTLPQGSGIAGQPLPLVQALSISADRRQQLAVTQAYWQTVEAVAKYHYCLDHVNQLGRLQSRPSEEVSLQAARWAATAALREAELTAGSAQHELAALVQFPPDAPLPLPADQPHVGAYRTNYQELFAARPAPDRARLIDRTLPIRRMAIDQRAIAIQAAQDALTAAIDAYQAGQGGLASVIAKSDQVIAQQRAFVETVCRYNRDIAEYAMIVAAPGATPQVLVGFMIKSAREPSQSSSAEGGGGVRPTGLNEPAPPSTTWNGNNQSTFAPRSVPGASLIPTVPPRTQWAPPAAPIKNEPTLAPPRPEPKLNNGRGESGSQQSEPDLKTEEPAKILHDSGDPFMRRVQKVNKPALEPAETSAALYPALVKASPGVQAKQLALALHWDRSLPENTGRSMTLEECLSRQPGTAGQAGHQSEIGRGTQYIRSIGTAGQASSGTQYIRSIGTAGQAGHQLEIGRGTQNNRGAAVEAFWTARQRAAEYQAVAQEIEFLDNILPLVLERRAKPDGAAAMLFLHAARQSAKANLEEAHAALIEAQFDLALRTQSAAESLWPLPATAPHAGQYLLNLEAQPRWLVQSWPMRRLAAAIPACSTSVEEHAASVVAADSARAKTIERYAAGNISIEQVVEDLARQTRETFDFLQTLSDYNRSIAQYALAVLPPDAPPARIASALVVQK